MRKDRTDSPLDALTEAQQDELFAVLQHTPYGKAVEWVQTAQGIATSVGSLARWWKRQSRRRLREQVRRGIQASAAFDSVVDNATLDDRMSKALKDGFFRLLAENDPKTALDFAQTAIAAGTLDAQRDNIQIKREESERRRNKALENGLQALFEEIKGNARAEALIAELRQTVSQEGTAA